MEPPERLHRGITVSGDFAAEAAMGRHPCVGVAVVRGMTGICGRRKQRRRRVLRYLLYLSHLPDGEDADRVGPAPDVS